MAIDLLAGLGQAYAVAFASYLKAKGWAVAGSEVFVGCDRRASSPELTAQVLAALTNAGLSPVFCGILPTPALALHSLRRGAAAVMVTGSHIPPDRNGLKFYRPDGEIDKADETAISALVKPGSASSQALASVPEPATEALSAYINRYKAAFPIPMLRGKRIGVYQHSSVAGGVLSELAAFLGAEIVQLGISNDFVAIDTEAIDGETAARLANWSTEHQLDAIVSTDGDGDRPLLSDETGKVIRGDTLGLICANFLKADIVVTPVSSNPGIEARFGSRVVRTKVGSPYVLEGMAIAARGQGRVIGFEANGGLLVGSSFEIAGATLDPLPTRDSVLPIFCAFAAAFESKLSLSRLVANLELPVCLSDRVENVPRADSDAFMAALRGSEEQRQILLKGLGSTSRIAEIDGLQIYLNDDSMIHFRPSGNAPEMRCYVSASSQARAAELLRFGLAAIENSSQSSRSDH